MYRYTVALSRGNGAMHQYIGALYRYIVAMYLLSGALSLSAGAIQGSEALLFLKLGATVLSGVAFDRRFATPCQKTGASISSEVRLSRSTVANRRSVAPLHRSDAPLEAGVLCPEPGFATDEAAARLVEAGRSFAVAVHCRNVPAGNRGFPVQCDTGEVQSAFLLGSCANLESPCDSLPVRSRYRASACDSGQGICRRRRGPCGQRCQCRSSWKSSKPW